MDDNPSHFFGCPECPVENMYFEDLQEFMSRLNQLSGLQYRLPTEAEWEYAARAGTTTRYHCGDDVSCLSSIAWCDHATDRPQPVGLKAPNGFGLYDMSGNVWERCQDWYDPNYYLVSPTSDPQGPLFGVLNHVRRGGSWVSRPALCRSTQRAVSGNPQHGYDLGFRLCLTYSTITTSIAPFTTTAPFSSTTSTAPNSLCPPQAPIDCGNGWCCSLDFPICGYGGDEGDCFSAYILEELYGDSSAETLILRSYRDEVLSTTQAGRDLIRLYYELSPSIVMATHRDEMFKNTLKEVVNEFLFLLEE